MHDEFREHAGAEFQYEYREQPISEAELLDAVSQAAGDHLHREHAAGGQPLERAYSSDGGNNNDAPAQYKQEIRWMPDNVIGVPTEREIHSTQDGGQVYRILFVRQ